MCVQWSYAYDNLNRLTGASATGQGALSQVNFTGALPAWGYDAFGNRLSETWGGTGSYTVPANTSATFASGTNQMNGASYTYDAAGDVTYDGINHYQYDAEGRICAVQSYGGSLTGYVYDAAGIRVAKGSLSTFSCNFSSNGYQTTTSWVLGPGGEQVTEYAVSGGTSTWVHTNAFASGALLATYHDTDTYFALEDWLGTKRVEVSAGGCYSWFTSMPYGNGLTPGGNCIDATEQHFTGKEHDAESGNDYFGARYYSDVMGRFMSPDWSAKEEPVPYAKLDDPQSLNLYAYVTNNPLSRVDADGHQQGGVITMDGIPIPLPNPAHPIVRYSQGYNLDEIKLPTLSLPQFQMPKLPSMEQVKSVAQFALTAGAISLKGLFKLPSILTSSTSVPSTAPGFVGDAGGNVVRIPAGSIPRTADNGNGTVYQPPVPAGAHKDTNAVRVMGPTAEQPTGSITVHGPTGQPINPATGKPDSKPNTHTPIRPTSTGP